jgi:hypothetical protein
VLGLGDEVLLDPLAHLVDQRETGQRRLERGRVEDPYFAREDRLAREGDLFEAGFVERFAEGRRGIFFVVDVPRRLELVGDGSDGTPSFVVRLRAASRPRGR